MDDFECDKMFCQALEAESGFGDWTGLDPPKWTWRDGRGHGSRGYVGWDGAVWNAGYHSPGEEYSRNEWLRQRNEEYDRAKKLKFDEWLRKNCSRCKGCLVSVGPLRPWLDGTTTQYAIQFGVEVEPFKYPGFVLWFKTTRKGFDLYAKVEKTEELKIGDCVEFWFTGSFPYCFSMVTVPVKSKWTDEDVRRLDLRNE